ncbi:ABC transporter substrate-binding protein [Streptomyces albipurpureus]|uniref:ABC transporter substrate-binding protein n=1 Tax=Streptomyces albipurpureus TaxID=2897419 RepID=A0ABT0UNU3_9ACTN|nr:ABC transporter substrate-binding protein [Streptomyces sp. CWNU-1]MCM2389765.1 ABC transporter substrate-binding protein [Streptomyces sp. CWNU-1]
MTSPDPVTRGIGRRGILKYTAVGAVGVSASALAPNGAFAASAAVGGDSAQYLRKLYQDALDEGGKLVVWAGGSSPQQEVRTREAFVTAFPGIDAVFTVRYSPVQSALVNRQLALGGLEPDLVQIQTLYDFDHWKAQNALLPYRPPGAQAVFPQYRDPDDAYIGIMTRSFGRVSNSALLTEARAPRDASDFLAPAFRDRIVIPDPTAEDAILFAFYLVTQKYGLRYMEQFMEQRPLIVANAGATTASLVSGERTATLAHIASLAPVPGQPLRYVVPRTDQFMSWPQTVAIFRKARHPAAAKLYIAWQLTVERQRGGLQWPTRRDVAPAGGWKPITQYNSRLNGFREFLRDRAAVERYRALIKTFVAP